MSSFSLLSKEYLVHSKRQQLGLRSITSQSQPCKKVYASMYHATDQPPGISTCRFPVSQNLSRILEVWCIHNADDCLQGHTRFFVQTKRSCFYTDLNQIVKPDVGIGAFTSLAVFQCPSRRSQKWPSNETTRAICVVYIYSHSHLSIVFLCAMNKA
jgi:hypothetical protein